MKPFFLFILISSCCFGAQTKPAPTNTSSIRVVPVDPTPEADNVESFISFPKANQRVYQLPVEIQLKLIGYPIGNMSDFDRQKELINDSQGQSMRIIVDEYPYLSIYSSFVDGLDNNNIFYDQTLTKQVPYDLDRGMHVIRAFPVRSYGESLKGSNCFAASVFYIGSKDSSVDIDLSGPYLTYNEPQGRYPYRPGRPILLDFYLSNTELSRDGYKVQLTIDGHVERQLTSWVPYFLYGLSRGKHSIKLELLDGQNKLVPGIFNTVEKEIILY